MQGEPFSTSLIVRVTVAEDGAVNGVIERPRTGEKHRFEGVEALGVLVAQIARKAAQITALMAVFATVAVGSRRGTDLEIFEPTAVPTFMRTSRGGVASRFLPMNEREPSRDLGRVRGTASARLSRQAP
jgi:branched-subunit amino acid ABC-type transport system permease component